MTVDNSTMLPEGVHQATPDFDIDAVSGFLPPRPSIARLPAPYDIWEEALSAARGASAGQGIRLVLTFLLHFYAHSAPAPPGGIDVPASIAIPLLAVCPLVGLPPVLTYSDLVLWNCNAKDGTRPCNIDDNPPVHTLASFSNTDSEAGFYIVSAETEAAGGVALRLIRDTLDDLSKSKDDIPKLTNTLRQLAALVDRIGDLTLGNNAKVDPEDFYHLIRLWFNGGDDGGGGPGWNFRGIDNELLGEAGRPPAPIKYAGPNAGQSALVHAIDIFLTVNHSGGQQNGTFMERMLEYMPASHRAFLRHLSGHAVPVRSLVIAKAESHPELSAAYDDALLALKVFRDKHMRVVTRFIVQQARRAPSARVLQLLGGDVQREVNEVDTSTLKGTGGTPLVQFLKAARDNTTRAMVG